MQSADFHLFTSQIDKDATALMLHCVLVNEWRIVYCDRSRSLGLVDMASSVVVWAPRGCPIVLNGLNLDTIRLMSDLCDRNEGSDNR